MGKDGIGMGWGSYCDHLAPLFDRLSVLSVAFCGCEVFLVAGEVGRCLTMKGDEEGGRRWNRWELRMDGESR